LSYNNKDNSNTDQNLFGLIISRFLPFWPLFAILGFVGILGAWAYLQWATPVYEVSATLIIKDKKKGVDDSNMTESINVFDSKKIVENEIEVIHSRDLMNTVARELCLYAPTYEETSLKYYSAYTSSPIVIELKDPDKIISSKSIEPVKYYFSFDTNKNVITVRDKTYPIDEWVIDSQGNEVKFKLNERKVVQPNNPLFYTYDNLKVLTVSLQESLEVVATNKLSSVVVLSYRDPVPERGEDILNRLISAYNQKAVDERNQLADNTLEFIDERMTQVGNELAALELEIEKYRSSKSVVDLSEQGKMYLYDVGTYDRQITDLRSQLAVLAKVESYVVSKKNDGGIVPSTLGVNDPVLTQLLQRLYNAEIDYERLRKTTAENNPILVSLSDEIEKIRPSILESIRNQQNNIRANLGNLSYNSERSSTALKSLPEKERTLLEITRRKMIKNDLFNFLQQKREETALSYAPNSGDSRVVDMAESTLDPVSPKGMFAYAMALALAMAIGIAYVTLKEQLSSKLMFRSEIENKTDIPVIAEFPELTEIPKKPLDKPQEPLVLAQFRHLGVKLGLFGRNFSKQKILVTSSIAGEGKSFISSNLALSLAASGKKVVLVDMDFRKPRISQLYGLLEEEGLIDFLKGKVDLKEITTAVMNNEYLGVIPAGSKGGDYVKLMQADKLELLFEYLSSAFDYVIVDSAPINLVSEVSLLAEFCNKVLFVTRHNHTPKHVVARMEKSSELKSFKDVSIIFNGVKQRGMIKNENGYGYGYEYGYGLSENLK